MGPDALAWPESVTDYDAAAQHLVCTSAPTVVTSWQAAPLQELLVSFLRAANAQRVLIKTSTAGRRHASHEVSPRVLADVLEAVSACSCKMALGDGPAFDLAYAGEVSRLGWAESARRFGARVVELNSADSADVAGWPVAREFLEADAVISLVKAKTHRRFGVSLSSKSLLGVLSGARLGYPKLRGRHQLVPWLIRELERASPPAFSVIDGFQAIEGNGPLDGIPSRSAFAVFGAGWFEPDVQACIEMGFDPAQSPGLLRPLPVPRAPQPRSWRSMRRTSTDLLPSPSLSWLWRSLATPADVRADSFLRLVAEIKPCWTTATKPE